MKIVLGIPVYNDLEFLVDTLPSMLEIGFDQIVYLDDGSTDGTYDFLVEQSRNNREIFVFRNKRNSILNHGPNRWSILTGMCSKFDPDWIMVRAADEKFSAPAKELLRPRLEELLNTDVVVVSFPMVHLWRSTLWFRNDCAWGYSAHNHVSDSCWKNNSGWAFVGDRQVANLHLGGHCPNKFSVNVVKAGINTEQNPSLPPPISILHYGMSSDALIERKLEFQLETSLKINGGIGLPPPNMMPHPSRWYDYNGYKTAYEVGIKFKQLYPVWLNSPVLDWPPEPKVKSLYNIIERYNKAMALEYAKIYGR